MMNRLKNFLKKKGGETELERAKNELRAAIRKNKWARCVDCGLRYSDEHGYEDCGLDPL